MIIQLVLGSILIAITVFVEVVFIEFAVKKLNIVGPKLMAKGGLLTRVMLLTSATLWLLAALSIAVWIWAAAFVSLDVFNTLEQSLYFSMVAFTTLGFGDITLPQEWRLMSGLIAANGLMLFGLNTAFLIEALRQILAAQKE